MDFNSKKYLLKTLNKECHDFSLFSHLLYSIQASNLHLHYFYFDGAESDIYFTSDKKIINRSSLWTLRQRFTKIYKFKIKMAWSALMSEPSLQSEFRIGA